MSQGSCVPSFLLIPTLGHRFEIAEQEVREYKYNFSHKIGFLEGVRLLR